MHSSRNGLILRRMLLFLILSFAGVLARETAGPLIISFNSGNTPLPPHLAKDLQIVKIEKWQIETAPQRWHPIALPFFTEFSEPNLHIKGLFHREAKDSLHNLILYSGGLHGYAEIKINGVLIGKQSFDYLPFELDISYELLKSGLNEIEINLRPPHSLNEGFPVLPHLFAEKQVWGIIRPLILYKAPQHGLSNLKIALKSIQGRKAKVFYRYNFDVPSGILKKTNFIKAEEWFTNDAGKVVFHSIKFVPISRHQRENTISVDTSYIWSTNNPRYITLRIVLRTDFTVIIDRSFRRALRKIEQRNYSLRLNEKRIFIKGVNYYQNISSYIKKNYYDLVRKDFKSLKEAGFNAVRFPHYVPDASVVRLADSLGLLVFSELPVWQYPPDLMNEAPLRSLIKNALLRFDRYFGRSPSPAAFSIGQELPLHDSMVLRLMIILQNLAKSNLSVPTYLSPIPGNPLPLRQACDFYIYDAYHPLQPDKDNYLTRLKTVLLAGRIGVLYSPVHGQESANIDLNQRRDNLSADIAFIRQSPYLQGGFIQSFADWKPKRPGLTAVKRPETGYIMPDGLFDYNHRPKYRLTDIKEMWLSQDTQPLNIRYIKTNFFSIIVFFASILFFAIYRRRKRLSDNIKRSLRNPYGFYIDLRERRVIPLYDSFLLGVFTAFLLATLSAIIIYYFHGSGGFQELAATLITSQWLYLFFLEISQKPYQLVLIFYIPLLLYPLVLGVILKFMSVFMNKAIRFRQFLAVTYWSGAPLIFMIPVVLVGYHWLLFSDHNTYLYVISALFIVWIHFRLARSIRLFLNTNSFFILLILLLSYVFPFLILWAVSKPDAYWVEYLVFLIGAQGLY